MLSFAALWFKFGAVLLNPGQYYFSKTADGLKSYYVALWHIKADDTYTHFEGMNYPYGEHIAFTDGNVPLVNTLKFFDSVFSFNHSQIVGIMNLFFLFSFIVASISLYLVFRKIKVSVPLAVLASVILIFISPQISRLYGHLSLSLTFAIPLSLYLLLLYAEKSNWIRAIVFSAFLIFLLFFHGYYYLFIAPVVFVYFVLDIIRKKRDRALIKKVLHLALMLALPVLVYQLWVLSCCSVADRPEYPWGFYELTSGWEGVFVAFKEYHNPLLRDLMNMDRIPWEGLAYFGHVASFSFLWVFSLFAFIPYFDGIKPLFTIIILIVGIVFFLLQRKRLKNALVLTESFVANVFLWTGFLLLILSFGWPFVAFPELTDFLGVAKQFRAIGRLAIPAFYLLNIGLIFYLDSLIQKGKLKGLIIFLITSGLLLFDFFTVFRASDVEFLQNPKLESFRTSDIEEYS
ncbi:MAG: hypothetical protein C0594_16300, partial [Marinilabiliales bacterium]